jgi:hypothetical protein
MKRRSSEYFIQKRFRKHLKTHIGRARSANFDLWFDDLSMLGYAIGYFGKDESGKPIIKHVTIEEMGKALNETSHE